MGRLMAQILEPQVWGATGRCIRGDLIEQTNSGGTYRFFSLDDLC